MTVPAPHCPAPCNEAAQDQQNRTIPPVNDTKPETATIPERESRQIYFDWAAI